MKMAKINQMKVQQKMKIRKIIILKQMRNLKYSRIVNKIMVSNFIIFFRIVNYNKILLIFLKK